MVLVLQLVLFLLGRIMDDMSWHDIGVQSEVLIFQGITLACMILCIIIQIIRKWQVEGMFKILFFRSQLKFLISWSLIITISVLFFNIFGCHSEIPQTELVFFFMVYKQCCINVTQIFLTNFNFSLICNTKASLLEFAIYQLVIFGEIIYNGTLLMMYIRNLQGVEKDLSILFISLAIANQILIMDLIFRAAYEDRERQEQKENKLIHHIIAAHHFIGSESPIVQNIAGLNNQEQPTKQQNNGEGNVGSQLPLTEKVNRIEQNGGFETELPKVDNPKKFHKK